MALAAGLSLLALLFAGQAWTYAARLVGRAGAVQILFVVGIAYAAYQLYAGWNTTEDSRVTTDYTGSILFIISLDVNSVLSTCAASVSNTGTLSQDTALITGLVVVPLTAGLRGRNTLNGTLTL